MLSRATITVSGKVTEIRGHENGTAVVVEIWCENQNGDKTTVGTGTAVI